MAATTESQTSATAPVQPDEAASKPAPAQPPQTSLYVGDLREDVVDQDLYTTFSKVSCSRVLPPPPHPT